MCGQVLKTSSISLIVHGVDVDVVYKKVKYLRIGVYPPLGQVRVSAPTRLGDEQVRLAVIERMPWILRQREHFQTAERLSRREMVSGESHLVWGAAHRLQVIEQPGRERVEVEADQVASFLAQLGADGWSVESATEHREASISDKLIDYVESFTRATVGVRR